MPADPKPTRRRRRRGNTLERWEIAIVKAMIARGKPFTNDQDILAYFTRPTRSVNHRLIAEIRTETKHKAVKSASDADLDAFLAAWPDLDPDNGLDNRGDELLKSEFGPQHGLEKRLPLVLQFVSFRADQRTLLKKAAELQAHVATAIDAFVGWQIEEPFASPEKDRR